MKDVLEIMLSLITSLEFLIITLGMVLVAFLIFVLASPNYISGKSIKVEKTRKPKPPKKSSKEVKPPANEDDDEDDDEL